jgi:tRNA(fMet)-specific endonuclease VapC
MAGNRFFLDSNIIIDIFHAKKEINKFLADKNTICIPVIVLGELLYGAENALDPARHFSQVENFIKEYAIVDIDSNSAEIYSKVKHRLRKLGKPIPDNDIWIAALAMQHNAILLTNDAHFKNIEALEFKQI